MDTERDDYVHYWHGQQFPAAFFCPLSPLVQRKRARAVTNVHKGPW